MVAEELTSSSVGVYEEWDRQLQCALPLVRNFTRASNSAIEPQVLEGVQQLIRFAFRQDYGGDPGIKNPLDIDWNLVAKKLSRAFRDALTPEVPEGLFLCRPEDRPPYFHNRGSIRLLPQDITLLINRFGITDGQPKKIPELAQKYGSGISSIAGKLNNARQVLRRSELRELVLDLPQPSQLTSPGI